MKKQSKELDRLEAYLTRKLSEAETWPFVCPVCERRLFDGDCARDDCGFAKESVAQ